VLNETKSTTLETREERQQTAIFMEVVGHESTEIRDVVICLLHVKLSQFQIN